MKTKLRKSCKIKRYFESILKTRLKHALNTLLVYLVKMNRGIAACDVR